MGPLLMNRIFSEVSYIRFIMSFLIWLFAFNAVSNLFTIYSFLERRFIYNILLFGEEALIAL